MSLNDKRIAKNTILLYFRMIIMMMVSLYTSRVVLNALGESDYGIYNVVGGIVSMFIVLSGSLTNAISRFITYEIGTNNIKRLQRIFSTSVNIQIIISVVIFVLCEIIGVWFLNFRMNIPMSRMQAANIVLQCSIITFIVNLISVPYNSVIIAHEKMNVFAYISIFEAIMKLTIAYLICISPYDRLITYATLLFILSLILRFIYGIYCNHHFDEARYHFVLDRPLLKEMFSFAGWNMFGSTAYILNTQGVSMLMNIHFGVVTNAARAIAVQVDTAVSQFVNSFMTAINPQITKSYASGDFDYLYQLISRGAKYSFFIMYLLIVPIILEADSILKIWLKQVPEDTTVFLRLVLCGSLSPLLSNTMYTAIMATGKIKRYQIIVTSVAILVFPLTWLAYIAGCPAYVTYIIYAILYFILNFIRIATLKKMINFPSQIFYTTVLSRILAFSVIAFIIPTIIVYIIPPSFLRLIIVCITSILWSIFSIYFIGLDKNERSFFVRKAKKLLTEKLQKK